MVIKPLILVVDDDSRILRLLRLALSEDDFDVLLAYNGEEAIRLVEKERPDLVILDLLMPQMDGWEVMRRLREHSDVRIIILTVQSRDEERVKALNLGADDYLVKPFSTRELVARVRAVLRRGAGTALGDGHRVVAGAISINLNLRQVTRGGEPVSLSRPEWRLLEELALHAGKTQLAPELLMNVWGPEFADDLQLLRVWIHKLRTKLEIDSSKPQIIKTIPLMGYVLEGRSEAVLE